MRTIEEIKAACEAHGICADYLDRWSGCRSKREVFDLGCTIEGLEYLAKGIRDGWGFSVAEIKSIFAKYTDGRYTSIRHPGTDREYDSEIWCGYDGDITVGTTCMGIFGCTGNVYVKPFHACHVFLDPSSDVEIYCPSTSRAVIRSSGRAVKVAEGSSRITFKEI